MTEKRTMLVSLLQLRALALNCCRFSSRYFKHRMTIVVEDLAVVKKERKKEEEKRRKESNNNNNKNNKRWNGWTDFKRKQRTWKQFDRSEEKHCVARRLKDGQCSFRQWKSRNVPSLHNYLSLSSLILTHAHTFSIFHMGTRPHPHMHTHPRAC